MPRFIIKDLVQITDPILRIRTFIVRLSSILSIIGLLSFFPFLSLSKQPELILILGFNVIINIYILYLTYIGKTRIAAYISYIECGIGMSVVILMFGLAIDFVIYLPIIMMLIFIYFEHQKEWLFFSIFTLATFSVPCIYISKFGTVKGFPLMNSDFGTNISNVLIATFSCGLLGYLAMKFLLDIIEQRTIALDALDTKSQLIKNKNVELELFATMASHDLKTPVRTIHSFLGLLEKSEEIKNPKALEYLELAKFGTQQLYDLINGISKFSTLDNNSKSGKFEKTRTIIKQLILIINPHKEDHIKIIHGELSDLRVLHSHLYHILQNLIENGLKYNDKSVREISISEKLKQDTIELHVCDNGIGIEKEYLKYIFEPFKKLHSSDKYLGSGLGLSICKKIVLIYKGQIEAESDEAGTRIIISLPRSLVI